MSEVAGVLERVSELTDMKTAGVAGVGCLRILKLATLSYNNGSYLVLWMVEQSSTWKVRIIGRG